MEVKKCPYPQYDAWRSRARSSGTKRCRPAGARLRRSPPCPGKPPDVSRRPQRLHPDVEDVQGFPSMINIDEPRHKKNKTTNEYITSRSRAAHPCGIGSWRYRNLIARPASTVPRPAALHGHTIVVAGMSLGGSLAGPAAARLIPAYGVAVDLRCRRRSPTVRGGAGVGRAAGVGKVPRGPR